MNAMDNVIGRLPALPRYILAAVLLCGLILATVVQRAAILKSGREVRLEVVPVDPRDLFRGDYVVFNYRIGTVNVPPDASSDFTRGQQVFVTLRPDASNKSRAVAVSSERPAVAEPDIVISGIVTSPSTCMLSDTGAIDCKLGRRAVGVRYGLESYFVPQGEGMKIEQIPKARLEVVAAIAPSGQAAIKRLLVDGNPVYDEPPY